MIFEETILKGTLNSLKRLREWWDDKGITEKVVAGVITGLIVALIVFLTKQAWDGIFGTHPNTVSAPNQAFAPSFLQNQTTNGTASTPELPDETTEVINSGSAYVNSQSGLIIGVVDTTVDPSSLEDVAHLNITLPGENKPHLETLKVGDAVYFTWKSQKYRIVIEGIQIVGGTVEIYMTKG